MEAEETVLQLTAPTAPAEDLSSVPNTHAEGFTTPYSSGSRGAEISWLLWALEFKYAYPSRDTHTHSSKYTT